MSSFSARDNIQRGSIVPPLDGLERPESDQVPDKCDVLICGTGVVQSILAAALAWQGSSVLHIDANGFYGDASASLSSQQLSQWVESTTTTTSQMDPQLYAPRRLDGQQYLMDLAPHVLFAKSDLLDLLIKSRVFKYLEFKPLSQFHTFEHDSFEKVAGSKQDIFMDQSLDLVTKRALMKLIKFILALNVSELGEYEKVPIDEFLSAKFQLQTQQITELVIALGLCKSLQEPTPTALLRIRRYLMSLDVYGGFPVLYSMYGSGGEIAQGFCRSAAVAGTTYKLNTRLESYDETTKVATLSDGSRVLVGEKVVISPTQPYPNAPPPTSSVTRFVAVVANDCREWFSENECAAIVVFPPGTVDNKHPVQTIVYGPGSGMVPKGFSGWYLSSSDPDAASARRACNAALDHLEKSILRESTEVFDLGPMDKDDVIYRENGTPVVSSLRMGQSMANFIPEQKLQYYLKFGYTQPAASQVEDPVKQSDTVLFGPHQLDEISYDGVVAQAKRLYAAVVGSDDDFFDVDFEDDNEERRAPPQRDDDEAMHDLEM